MDIRHTLLLGGTFDPPHWGHIRPLQQLMQQWPFDDCWLMPNHIPPHKAGPHASSNARLAMLRALCEELPGFSLCTVELERDTPSYTVHTLRRLRELYPSRRFYFVMGMDSFLNLPGWHQWQTLFCLCHLVVCERPGYALDKHHPMAAELERRIFKDRALPREDAGRVLLADINELDISSSAIRDGLHAGKDMSLWLPAPVEAFIRSHNLYD